MRTKKIDITLITISTPSFSKTDFLSFYRQHLPPHARKKKGKETEKPKPYVLQTLPPAGCLAPGEKTNIRIMFTPLEEVGFVYVFFDLCRLSLSWHCLRYSFVFFTIPSSPLARFLEVISPLRRVLASPKGCPSVLPHLRQLAF